MTRRQAREQPAGGPALAWRVPAGPIRIVWDTLLLAGIGVALGTAVSWALAHSLEGLLYGVTPADPATFGGMLAVLVTVALLAGYVPGRRASRVDPSIALRAN